MPAASSRHRQPSPGRPVTRRDKQRDARTARTVRFPDTLRDRIAQDAERCGRSFEAQVLAVLRRHYGDDVDLAPAPETILGFALGSFESISEADLERFFRRAGDDDDT